MRNILSIILVLSTLLTFDLNSQQLPLFTQYSEYQGIINPAAVNYDFFQDGYPLAFGTSIRQQWRNVPTAPKTMLLRGEYFWETGNTFNVLSGGYVINDQVGYISTTGIFGRIAIVKTSRSGFRYNASDNGLSVGLLGGIVQYRVDTPGLQQIAVDKGDQALGNRATLIRPDVGIGISYYYKLGGRSKDYIFLGLSVPQVLGLTIEFPEGFDIVRTPHYYATGSYFKALSKYTHFEITTWVRKVKSVPVSLDVVAKYRFHQSIWFGIGMNSVRHVSAEFGLTFDSSNYKHDHRYKLAFSFNPFGPSYRGEFGDTFEVNLSYMIN